MYKYVPLILATVTTNAISQLCLKQGMLLVGHFHFSPAVMVQMLPKVILNPFIVLGLITLVLSMGLHLMVLSRVDLSYAYPFLSISYVLVLAAGYFLFNEPVNVSRVFGVALICVGTFFIARS
ncbi:MAG: EamA family transporter [Pyrinomonadaceae bacterium]